MSYSTEPNCTAVNMNDFLGRVLIYNAKTFGVTDSYDVNAILIPDLKTEKVGTAIYNAEKEILTFNSDAPICLSRIQELEFIKQ
jgi:hypothetical protein